MDNKFLLSGVKFLTTIIRFALILDKNFLPELAVRCASKDIKARSQVTKYNLASLQFY